MKILNGVKAFSMYYVVFGHVYFALLQTPTSNGYYYRELVQAWWFSFIYGFLFAVDVFFFVSAFMSIYYLLMDYQRTKKFNILLIYFQRFFKLSLQVLLVIMFFTTLYEYFGTGPVWLEMTKMWIGDCPKYWWTFVLFINSLYAADSAV